MKTIIHINRFSIDRNRKAGEVIDKPIIVKTYKGTEHAMYVDVSGPCRIVYSPDEPLSGCGARVWIETQSEVKLDGSN